MKLSEPGTGVVAFTDQDITAPGDWLCTKNHTVVFAARIITTLEESLFTLKDEVYKRLTSSVTKESSRK